MYINDYLNFSDKTFAKATNQPNRYICKFNQVMNLQKDEFVSFHGKLHRRDMLKRSLAALLASSDLISPEKSYPAGNDNAVSRIRSAHKPGIKATNYRPAMQEIMSRPYPIIAGNQFRSKDLDIPLAQRVIKDLDLVIVNKTDDLFIDKGANASFARYIHKYNPRVKVLQYLNLIDVWENQDSFQWMKDKEAILLDDAGNPVHPYQKNYGTKRWAADPTNRDWQKYYAERAKSIIDQGLDGIFSDNWFRTNSQNWNINGQRFSTIQQAWEMIGRKTKAEIGEGKILIGNSPAHNGYQSRDASMIEMRNAPNSKDFNNYLKWSDEASKYTQANLDTISWMNGRTYMSSPESVLQFSLPACLLTDNIFGIPNDNDIFSIIEKVGKIGSPLAPRYRAQNILQRNFTGGKVLFNDTDKPVVIKLPLRLYKDLDNNPVSTVSLDSFRGIILKTKK